jgi:myo-inositol-1(or 4)-monophosphatase
MTSDDLLPILRALSATARAVTLGAPVPQADNKAGEGGFDPVTEIDRAAERALRAELEQHFPTDGIEGEEYGLTRPEAARRWLLDPVDGTRALICGLPSWTTLVALMEDGEPTHGFIDAPMLGELAIGAPGKALLNGKPVQSSGCKSLAEARFTTTDPYLFTGAEFEGFERIRGKAMLTRYGLDALGYAKLAAGSIDLVVESGLKRHDWAALVPVVRGAGGVIGNWRGENDFSEGKVVAAATPQLFEEVVVMLDGRLR